MSNRLARFGNDLHSGRTSYPFVQKRGCLLYTSDAADE